MLERWLVIAMSLWSVPHAIITPAHANDDAARGSKAFADAYARAQRFLPHERSKYLVNVDVDRGWIGKTDRFWYRRTGPDGNVRFWMVDARTGRQRMAFDHARFAAGLTMASGRAVDADELPISKIGFGDNGGAMTFDHADSRWSCVLPAARCVALHHLDSQAVLSPDGKWAAFVKDHNLWIRAVRGGNAFALTRDGSEHHGYAEGPGDGTVISMRRAGYAPPAQVIWSPDSRRLLTHRLDERSVRDFHLIESVPPGTDFAPKLHSYKYAIPGDKRMAMAEPLIFDIATRGRVAVNLPAMEASYVGPLSERTVRWSEDGSQIFIMAADRFARRVNLINVGASDGSARVIVSDTYATSGPNRVTGTIITPVGNGDVLWASERDGWQHLYRYKASGELLNQVTRGPWRVARVVRVDPRLGRVYFMGTGLEPKRNPYFEHLYVVNLDGSGLRLLTREDANHDVSTSGSTGDDTAFSSSGRYFLDSYSRPDLPPVLVLGKADGAAATEILSADITRLRKDGFSPPEPFEVMSADGTVSIHGNLYRPSDFDAAKRYPVIESVYAGPQVVRSARDFSSAVYDWGMAQAIADLGFVVVTIDARGTPSRSKAFLDKSYGRLGSPELLEDHIAGIRQLAARFGYMDLERVGIVGHSGGGYASTHALLLFPDFYKAAVSTAGNHEMRAYLTLWSDSYMGPDPAGYVEADNALLAARLKGKLLLVHGEMDDNVHPAQTLRVVDALVKANKDFEMLYLPGADHSGADIENPYVFRRAADFLVRHLQGKDPPPWQDAATTSSD